MITRRIFVALTAPAVFATTALGKILPRPIEKPPAEDVTPLGCRAVNVKRYGAVGDGTTDDTAAFAAAIATAKDVFVPAGTFKVTDTLSMDRPYQRLFGNGPLSEVRFTFTSSKIGIELTNSSGRQQIRNLYLHGTRNISKLVDIKAPQVAIEGCRVVNETTTGHCVYSEDENTMSGIYSFGLALRNNFIYGSLRSGAFGVRLGLNSQTARIVGNIIENCGTLVKVENATNNLVIRDNALERSVNCAIDFDKSSATPLMANITIEDNYFEENQVCIHAKGGEFHDISIRRNSAYRNTAAKLSSFFYYGDTGASAASDDIYVEENHIEDFDTALELAGEYTSRLRGTKGNTLLNCNRYVDSTYSNNAYQIRTINGYFSRKLVLGSFSSEAVNSLNARTAVFAVAVPWDSHEYLDKITFKYVQLGGTGVTVELRSITCESETDALVSTVTANTDGVKTISVGGYADPTLNYYLNVTYDGTGTSGSMYPFRLIIQK
jgi:hypothetical protein